VTFPVQRRAWIADCAGSETRLKQPTFSCLIRHKATTPHPSLGYIRSGMQLTRVHTALVDDSTTAHITYNDKYVIVFDFSGLG